MVGAVAGPAGLDLLPPAHNDWYPIVSTVALMMIGFLVGGHFTGDRMHEDGREVAVIAVVQALVTAGVVALGLVAAGFAAALALPLAGIAAATAPASTVAVVQEAGSAGWLSRTIVGIVALDDLITIVLFSLLLSIVGLIEGSGADLDLLSTAAREIGGATLLALLLGVPVAFLTGRLRPGEPTREEAVGVVLVAAGVALWLEVSFLLTAVVLGAVVANLAKHHERPFREIENIEWPFMVVFFVLAGAEFRFSDLCCCGIAWRRVCRVADGRQALGRGGRWRRIRRSTATPALAGGGAATAGRRRTGARPPRRRAPSRCGRSADPSRGRDHGDVRADRHRVGSCCSQARRLVVDGAVPEGGSMPRRRSRARVGDQAPRRPANAVGRGVDAVPDLAVGIVGAGPTGDVNGSAGGGPHVVASDVLGPSDGQSQSQPIDAAPRQRDDDVEAPVAHVSPRPQLGAVSDHRSVPDAHCERQPALVHEDGAVDLDSHVPAVGGEGRGGVHHRVGEAADDVLRSGDSALLHDADARVHVVEHDPVTRLEEIDRAGTAMSDDATRLDRVER